MLSVLDHRRIEWGFRNILGFPRRKGRRRRSRADPGCRCTKTVSREFKGCTKPSTAFAMALAAGPMSSDGALTLKYFNAEVARSARVTASPVGTEYAAPKPMRKVMNRAVRKTSFIVS
jgi:hypothetical protein